MARCDCETYQKYVPKFGIGTNWTLWWVRQSAQSCMAGDDLPGGGGGFAAALWSMLGLQLFFCTGHFCEFAGLQFTAGARRTSRQLDPPRTQTILLSHCLKMTDFLHGEPGRMMNDSSGLPGGTLLRDEAALLSCRTGNGTRLMNNMLPAISRCKQSVIYAHLP